MPGHTLMRRASSSNSCATSATDRRVLAAAAFRSRCSDCRSRIVVKTRGSGRADLGSALRALRPPEVAERRWRETRCLMATISHDVGLLNTTEYRGAWHAPVRGVTVTGFEPVFE